MSKIRNLLLLACLSIMATTWAASINENQARQIATKFMAGHAMRSSNLKMAHKAPVLNATASNGQAAYYVFNADNADGGYVIVAGDDRVPAVLGYSEYGTFDSQDVPEAMQYLLEGYAAQIGELAHGAKSAPQLRSAAAISPLVTAKWSQNNPYNILLPYIPSGKHAYAGCVATALAQVMHYWKWPARPTRPIAAYTSVQEYTNETLTYEMPELPVIDFNWSVMKDTYETSDTLSEAARAAATLTLYCDQAVQMTFKKTSSGASTASIPNFASAYFDYDAAAHMAFRTNYTSQEWADLIYDELTAGRPVIFSGSKKSGGHAFICDGYDGDGMFHFNWGWNGMSNGYFLLNVLNPDQQGTGSASGAYGYILDQGCIVGFQPNKGNSNIFELTASDVVLNSYNGTRAYSSDEFSAVVSGRFRNLTSDTIDVRFGWGLFDGDQMIERLYSAYNHTLKPGYYHTHTERSLSFGENLTSGTYRIMPMYSEYGQDNWRPCVGSDKNYIEVTINGNQCIMTGHGTAGECDYTINDITMTGYMHNGRPIDINVNMTNNGDAGNKILYLFSNGTLFAAGYVNLEKGETGDIQYIFMTDNAGEYTLTWSFNEDGSDPIASRTITINQMPAASLTGTINILNITDASNKIITSEAFSMEVNITNNGTTTYDEDISVKLYKHTAGSSGSSVQAKNQHLTLAPGASTTLRFDMDNVEDGWKYFAYAYFYTEGTQTKIKGTSTYTIVFPEKPEFTPGDVNNDGIVNISDVTALIDYLLNTTTAINEAAADVNEDGTLNISDVTTLIDMLLKN